MNLVFKLLGRLNFFFTKMLNQWLKWITNIKKSLIQKGLSGERDFNRRDFKETKGNAHLFIQDISQHKMPYRQNLTNYPNFKVIITGTEIDKAKRILNNLSQHTHYTDTDLVSDVINNLSKKNYYWGKVYYLKNNEITGPLCIEIWPLGVFKIFRYYLQLIPKTKKNKESALYRFENAANVFCFSMSTSQSQKLKFFLIKRMLNRDRTAFPPFFVEDKFQNGNFDLKCYKNIEAIFLALITKKYAWKLRYLADDYKNEYFRFYSSYLSAIRNAEDREIILNQINRMLIQFKVDAKLTIEGIPTSNYLKNSLQEMEEGKKTFSDALKDIYLT